MIHVIHDIDLAVGGFQPLWIHLRIYTHVYILTHCSRDYNSATKHNDIAIILLKSAFEYTEFIRPACLPETTFDVHDGSGIVSGFGETQNGKFI